MSQNDTNSILIIDDSPEQIRYVSELLREEKCKVYASLSCADAFTFLEKKIPDLILLDIVMPGMDGFTFCRKIKADARTSGIPVIFATAYNDKEYIGKSFEAGGSDYVVKPFIREELLERVKVRIQLAQKEQELKKAYDELDKFCYTVSHDIRSPLYVVQQLSELLTDEVRNGNYDEAEKICGMLIKKAKQAATMTEGLHRFSKVFYEELHVEDVDMDSLFRDVYEELAFIENDRVITYKQDKLPSVKGDLALLRIVVQNIIGNALKFTRNNEHTFISVSAVINENQIGFSVADNGIGIDSKEIGEVFKVFRKFHSTEYEGDGIGLASVKRILLRHGGDVEIASKVGKGTTVTFFLPAV